MRFVPAITMPKLHCHVSAETAERLKRKAAQAHLPVSKYLAALINKDTGSEWPDDYFEQVFGQWQGDRLQRPAQGDYEDRAQLG